MSRLNLEMSIKEIVMAMVDGNPGAVQVVMGLVENNAEIDPMSFLGPITAVTQLDGLGIYGSDIWCLYKDVCGTDLIKLMAVIRANQMGLVSADYVKNATEGSIDVDLLYKALRMEIPSFNAKAH